MLNKILEVLKTGPVAPEATIKNPFERKQVAAAALMVEAARLDKDFDDDERTHILKVVRERFGLSEEEAQSLVEVAEESQRGNYSNWMFTKTIEEGFTDQERMEIAEMLWEVAYADGHLHRFENHMIAEVAERIGVSETDLESARQEALNRLGLSDPNA